MYPNLSYLFHALFGTQPDNWTSIFATFGFMLIVAIFCSALLLRVELKRKEQEGLLKPSIERQITGKGIVWSELLGNAFWGFVIGFKFIHLLQNFKDIGDPVQFLFSMQGNLLYGLVLMALFVGYYIYNVSKTKLDTPKVTDQEVWPHERVWDIAVIAGLSGVAGAKLFASFESIEGAKAFFRNPIEQLVSGSGLAIYGGLIVAFIVVYRYVQKKGITPIHVMDAIAPSLMLGYGIGRMGCQLSGDGDWGIVNTKPAPSWWIFPDSWWSFDYPHNVLNQGIKMEGCDWNYCYRLAEGVYPTPIYEIIASFIIVLILWSLRKRIKVPGMLFFIYLIFNGIERFLIEKIRVNDKIPMLGMELTQAEIISVLLLIVGVVGCFILRNRANKKLI